MSLTESQQTVLLTLARESIAQGLKTAKPLKVNLDEYPPEMAVPRATFVTLEYNQKSRGSVGMLEAVRPLVEDVAENAFAAAFCDRRFLPLADHELADLQVQISILSPVEEMTFSSELDLLDQLRPNVDGLILQEGSQQASLLPSAWKALRSPMQFLRHLKQEVGLPEEYWSNTIKVYRYTTENIIG